jgi:hypothetical protein
MRISLLILLFYTASANFQKSLCCITDKDSVHYLNDVVDSAQIKPVTKNTSTYSLSIFGGLGLTTGSCWDIWERLFNIGYVSSLGIEFPIPESHVALEISGLTWISKPIDDSYHINYALDKKAYIVIQDDLLSQISLAGSFKYYIGPRELNYNASVQLGYLVCYPDYKNFVDFGYAIYYSITEKGTLSLSHRFYLGRDFNAESTIDTPNFLLLNYFHRINF